MKTFAWKHNALILAASGSSSARSRYVQNMMSLSYSSKVAAEYPAPPKDLLDSSAMENCLPIHCHIAIVLYFSKVPSISPAHDRSPHPEPWNGALAVPSNRYSASLGSWSRLYVVE